MKASMDRIVNQNSSDAYSWHVDSATFAMVLWRFLQAFDAVLGQDDDHNQAALRESWQALLVELAKPQFHLIPRAEENRPTLQ